MSTKYKDAGKFVRFCGAGNSFRRKRAKCLVREFRLCTKIYLSFAQSLYFILNTIYYIRLKELYIDISSEEAGGSLYRITGESSPVHFYYNHSTYNSDTDELKVFETNFADFEAFWKYITANKQWFYLHPLFIHPEQRDFIGQQLAAVNWAVSGDKKWQDSHQRQWKKVLNDPGGYYKDKL